MDFLSSSQKDQGDQTSGTVPPGLTAWGPAYQGLTPSQGFKNTSVLCYRNSALWFILHSPGLVDWLASHHGNQGCVEECLRCQLHRLAASFWKEDGTDNDPETALGKVWNQLVAHGKWGAGEHDLEQQQDVREFIELLFREIWLETYAGVVDLPPLAELLRITINNYHECKACGKERYISEDQAYFCVAPLSGEREGTGPVDIETLLRSCYSGSTLEDHECDCEDKPKLFLVEKVTRLPKILLIHLNRIRDGTTKSFRDISLGNQIVLPDSLRRNLTDEDGSIRYELYTIIFHDGHTINSGHYTAAAKAPTGQWMLMNDDRKVQHIQSLAELMDMGSGERKHSATAYICAYRRLPPGNESDPAVQVPAEMTPGSRRSRRSRGSPSSPSSVDSRGSAASPIRSAVTMDGSINFHGRDVEWMVQQELSRPSDDGPLINLKPRARVQHATVRLKLTSGEEILEGAVVISLNPKTQKQASTKSSSSTETNGVAGRKTKRQTSSRRAKPKGVEKAGKATKARSIPKTRTKATKEGQTRTLRKRG